MEFDEEVGLELFSNNAKSEIDSIPELPIMDGLLSCMVLSWDSIASIILRLFFINAIFGFMVQKRIIRNEFYHILNASCGLYLLWTMQLAGAYHMLAVCFAMLTVLFYVSALLLHTIPNRIGILLKLVFVVFLIVGENLYFDPEHWARIRGILMIIIMKIISLLDNVTANKKIPRLMLYLGYTLSGANILFGPWIPLEEYLALPHSIKPKNINWISSLIRMLTNITFFLLVSNCWASFFTPESISITFVLAFRDALIFRTSHYFISSLAEFGLVSMGYRTFSTKVKRRSRNPYRYFICDPIEIEIPLSLLSVVRNWNQPMHVFLKEHIYSKCVWMGKFAAIVITFTVSASLHALDLRLAMVLINLGVFCYAEWLMTSVLKRKFSICLKETQWNSTFARKFLIKILKSILIVINVIHLTYLGMIMEPSTEQIGVLSKWASLHFISHAIVVFVIFVTAWMQ